MDRTFLLLSTFCLKNWGGWGGGGEWCGEERASLITRFVMKMCIQAFKATIDTFCSTPFKAFRHCRPHLPEGFDCFTRACLWTHCPQGKKEGR